MLPILYIIIPCYNEEKVLPITSGMFLDKIRELVDAQKTVMTAAFFCE